MQKLKNNSAWMPWLYALTFAAACVWILNKCRFGFAGADESFYTTILLRLVRGDGLFVHEWHLSQMSSFLTLPIMYIYMKLVGTTVGIALAFRYIFTFVWIAGSLFVFFRLRRKSFAAAAITSMITVLYTPFGIMAMSYNSLGILNMMLSLVLLCTAERRFTYGVSGLFFAAAVLCCPYLAAVYALYSAALLVYGLRHREALATHWKDWLLFTAGAALLAVLFLTFVLSRASVADVADAVPNMLSDPEHKPRSVPVILLKYVMSVAFRNAFLNVVFLAAVVVLIVTLALRKKSGAAAPLYVAVCVCIAAWLCGIWVTDRYINFLMLPLQVFPWYAILVGRDNRIRQWFWFGYLPVIAYTWCVHATSNQRLYVISSVCMAAMPATLMMIMLVTKQVCFSVRKPFLRNGLAAALALLVVLQIGMEGVLRYAFVFREDGMGTLTSTVEVGSEKGLHTTSKKKERYESLYTQTQQFCKDHAIQSVLYLTNKTYLYVMEQDVNMATFSAWQSGVKQTTLDRLDAYYALHPDKVPQAVFYDADCTTEMPDSLSAEQAAAWAAQFSMTAVPTESGDIWFVK